MTTNSDREATASSCPDWMTDDYLQRQLRDLHAGPIAAEVLRLRKESKRERADKAEAKLAEVARILGGNGDVVQRAKQSHARTENLSSDLAKACAGRSEFAARQIERFVADAIPEGGPLSHLNWNNAAKARAAELRSGEARHDRGSGQSDRRRAGHRREEAPRIAAPMDGAERGACAGRVRGGVDGPVHDHTRGGRGAGDTRDLCPRSTDRQRRRAPVRSQHRVPLTSEPAQSARGAR